MIARGARSRIPRVLRVHPHFCSANPKPDADAAAVWPSPRRDRRRSVCAKRATHAFGGVRPHRFPRAHLRGSFLPSTKASHLRASMCGTCTSRFPRLQLISRASEGGGANAGRPLAGAQRAGRGAWAPVCALDFLPAHLGPLVAPPTQPGHSQPQNDEVDLKKHAAMMQVAEWP